MDEAGRGSVLGPLVVAGVAVADSDLLASLGCRDSKRLTPDRRRAIDRALRAHPDVRVVVRAIDAPTLDLERRAGRGLNAIEAMRFRDIAAVLAVPTVWVDAADANAARFGTEVGHGLACRIVSEHKADERYPVVGAASIVAKVARDEAVADLARRLERRLGLPLGSGYPSDAKTRAFLAGWHRTFGTWPEGTRTTWATLSALRLPQTQLPSDQSA